jgi:hypothetical protein
MSCFRGYVGNINNVMSKNMRDIIQLTEFVSTSTSPPIVIPALEAVFGKLQRVGGNERVYQISGEGLGTVYTCGTVSGIGLCMDGGSVSTIYYWAVLNLDKEPDYAIDIPADADFSKLSKTIYAMVSAQSEGKVEVQ